MVVSVIMYEVHDLQVHANRLSILTECWTHDISDVH